MQVAKDAQLIRGAFNQDPSGFGAATFHAENAFGWVHDCLRLAGFAPFESTVAMEATGFL